MEFGGNVEGQRLVRCVDRGAWMRRGVDAVRGCDERGGRARRERSLLAPTLCGEKMMMPSRGRAEGRWSGVPGWRDDAMR